ncbi:invasin domain 3-containing protein, partial [Algoriphagus aquatilis]
MKTDMRTSYSRNFRKAIYKFGMGVLMLFVAGFFNFAFSQIQQRGSVTSATSTNTNLTINTPSGVQAGDVLIVNIVKENNGSTDPSAIGWTLLESAVVNGIGGDTRASVLYRIAGASEPSNYTFALGTGTNDAVGAMLAFSGVRLVGNSPFDVIGSFTVSPNSSDLVNASSITTSVNGAAIIMFGQANNNRTWSDWSTATSPGALTELYDVPFNSANDDLSVGAAWAIKNNAGSTGIGTTTLSGDARNSAILIALRPELPDPTRTTITASPSTINSDGLSNSTIIVQLKSSTGVNLSYSAGPVILTSPSGTLSNVVDNLDGTYSASFTSTTVGAVTISGSINSSAISNSANITVLENCVSSDTSIDLNYQNVNISGLTLVNGTQGAVNSRYIRNNAITVNGRVLNVEVTITGRSNVTDFILDNDGSNAGRLQPEINSSSTGGSFVDFDIKFFDNTTSQQVSVKNFLLTGVDVDGSGTSREFIEISGFSSYSVDATSQLVVQSGTRSGFTRFLGRTSSLGGITFDNTASFVANYQSPVSQIQIRMGNTNSSAARRLFSVNIGASVGSFSNTVSTSSDLIVQDQSAENPCPGINYKTVTECETVVATYTSLRPATWTIFGGEDSDFFQINSTTGQLSFKAPRDFENPVDRGAGLNNNSYVVVIRAVDSNGVMDFLTVTVNVSNLDPSLRFVSQPGDITYGDNLGNVTVELLDECGQRANSNAPVTLTINNGAGLTGTVTVNAVNGLVTFTGVSVNKAGDDYKLSASSAGVSNVESIEFDVSKASLTVTAIDDTKVYNGLAYSNGNGVNYSGFVNGENSSVLGGSL